MKDIAISSSTHILCYGEVLWDILPNGLQPGGAPLNVAYHLQKLGVQTGIISKIGNDYYGEKLHVLLDKWAINKEFLQVDEAFATSEVLVKFNNNEASYDILYPVAWDFIMKDDGIHKKLTATSYFVYGSLSSRNQTSYNTLLSLLENNSAKKIFDVNFRDPYVNKSVLEELLRHADVIKFNYAELDKTSVLFGGVHENERDQVKFLQYLFNAPEIIVTKGGEGASYYINEQAYYARGPAITVNDTVGSGDALLAAFIWGKHQGDVPQTIINNAVAMGAFIATKEGGCPDYQINEYQDFKNNLK